MSDTLIVALISAAVSLIVSLLAASLKNKGDLTKTKREQEHGYAKALFEKRVEIYPQLYNYLSDFAKVIRSNTQNTQNLAEFKHAVDEWNSRYSLFFTNPTSVFSSQFRYFLQTILNRTPIELSADDWENIRQLIGYFEDFLRAEIGIFVSKPVGDVVAAEERYEFLNRLIDRSRPVVM